MKASIFVKALCATRYYDEVFGMTKDQHELPDNAKDWVNAPSHYKGNNGLQAVDVIEAFPQGTHIDTAMIYLLRAGNKDPREQDLKKALWWIMRELQFKYGKGTRAEMTVQDGKITPKIDTYDLSQG